MKKEIGCLGVIEISVPRKNSNHYSYYTLEISVNEKVTRSREEGGGCWTGKATVHCVSFTVFLQYATLQKGLGHLSF